MARGVFGSLLIGLSVLVFFFWTYPIWNDISLVKDKQAEVKSSLERVINLERKRDEIAAQYNAISADDRAKLNEFFPRSPESGLFIMNLDNISNSNGMLLKKIDLDESGKAVAQQQSGAEQASEKFISLPFQILVSGNYDSFLRFLDAIEKSRRLIDIDKLTFSSGSVVDGAKSKGDFYEYSISAHTYWKK